jgi:hypothetical protein
MESLIVPLTKFNWIFIFVTMLAFVIGIFAFHATNKIAGGGTCNA